VIQRAVAAGIERLLVPGYDLESSRQAVRLAQAYPGTIQAAVGIHPHYAGRQDEHAWSELAALAEEREVVAVGEIGLDFFRNLSPPDIQRQALARQLSLAARLEKPVLVHDRDAHAEVRVALMEHAEARGGEGPLGVLHAFSGDGPLGLEMAERGYLISFALPVAFRSATGPRDAARALPAESFLVETDSPWLAPGGAEQRNEPTTALRVATVLARLREVEPEDIATEVRMAYERLIGV
jgi:TatD DNase family protein